MNNPTSITPVTTDSIIALLSTQKDNMPVLRDFIKSKDLKPATIFLPQTLKMLDAELSSGQDVLVHDCINFLDAIKIYSLAVYGDSEIYLDRIEYFIVENRTVENLRHTLSGEALDDFFFSKKEDAMSFLKNNKFIVAMYVYTLINFILYSEA